MNHLNAISSNRMLHAVILCVIAALCNSIMTLLVKLTAAKTTGSMTVFFRFAVSSLWILLVLSYKRLNGKQFPLKTKRLGLHIVRAATSFVSIFCLYYALKYVPLVAANSLVMTYTLFIPILSFIFFDTKTSTKNWLALLAGFIGIIFILKPHSSAFNPMALLALISAITLALSFLWVYELAKNDQPYTIMLYFFPIIFVISSICVIFNWKTPSLNTLILLFIAGIFGTIYQELITRSMLYAPPKIVAPLLYSGMVFSGIFDWIFWHNIPDSYFWLGAILVVVGCIFSIKYTKV